MAVLKDCAKPVTDDGSVRRSASSSLVESERKATPFGALALTTSMRCWAAAGGTNASFKTQCRLTRFRPPAGFGTSSSDTPVGQASQNFSLQLRMISALNFVTHLDHSA